MNLGDEYDDEDIIYKYGYTKNLEIRATQHAVMYGKIEGVEIKLVFYARVDVKYLVDAENDIRDVIKEYNMPLKYKKAKELVVIPNDMINHIKKKI